ncbi:hypothetical protein G7046_g5100 [Stylonectria norvegica]|nr:hypothetical protein G7046_g5100 [Stylonectria norvegica]
MVQSLAIVTRAGSFATRHDTSPSLQPPSLLQPPASSSCSLGRPGSSRSAAPSPCPFPSLSPSPSSGNTANTKHRLISNHPQRAPAATRHERRHHAHSPTPGLTELTMSKVTSSSSGTAPLPSPQPRRPRPGPHAAPRTHHHGRRRQLPAPGPALGMGRIRPVDQNVQERPTMGGLRPERQPPAPPRLPTARSRSSSF